MRSSRNCLSDGKATTMDVGEVIDKSRLTRRYWICICMLSTLTIFENFDLYVIGFLGSSIAGQDHLKYWQLSLILVAAGVGAVIGALFWGHEGDRRGRVPSLVLGAGICGVSSVCFLIVPSGAWPILVLLRLLVGFGIAGASTAAMTLAVEYTPVRHRALVTGLPVIGATMGTLVASATVAGLISRLGWQGIAALGVIPALLGIVSLPILPESPLWLARRGRLELARASLAKLQALQLAAVPALRSCGPDGPSEPFMAVFRRPRRAFLTVSLWGGLLSADYGVYLLGPTLVALSTGSTSAAVARVFMMVSLGGILGKIGFSLLPRWIARRRLNEVGALGATVFLSAAAFLYRSTLGGISVLAELLIVGAIFFDGTVANLAPYTVEIYPTELAARGYGLGQAANGVGKLAAPLAMAIIAGGAYVTPAASLAHITPTFLFLAACALMAGAVSILIPIDPLPAPGARSGSRAAESWPS